MLLAAGFGRRMVPLTLLRAKPTLPFVNRPLLLRQFDYLRASGIDEVVVNVHHRPESILALLHHEARQDGTDAGGAPRFRMHDLVVHVSVEEMRLGTSGGVKRAAHHFTGSEPFVCLNSDMVTEIDLGAVLAAHRGSGRPATLVLTQDRGQGFTPVFHDGQQILAFGAGGEGSPGGRDRSSDADAGRVHGVFTGIHVLEPALLERLPEGRSEFLPALYLPMLAAGEAPGVHLGEGRWVEVGSAGRYIDAQAEALQAPFFARHVAPAPADSSLGRACGAEVAPVSLWGERCQLGWGTLIGPGTILGDDVAVEEAARLTRCVVLDGARIGAGTVLERVVVGPRTQVPGGETIAGALLQAPAEGLADDAVQPAHEWRGIWRVDL